MQSSIAQITILQTAPVKKQRYDSYFKNAYSLNTNIPKGILEAMAYTMTRIKHIDSSSHESCEGLPRVYGVMGLTLDGKGYFRNNLIEVSRLSGHSVKDIISKPEINILAFAKAYSTIIDSLGISSNNIADHLPVLISLSELPLKGLINDFALSSHIYSVLTFLNTKEYQVLYGFPNYNISLVNVFGQHNYKILSSSKITVSGSSVKNNNGQQYKQGGLPVAFSADYPPALWNPTTCNYSSRNSTAISAVTIHTVQGTYAGCISWFKNCNSSVSAHYVIRSSDGQVTQMVLESNKAWHVGTENPYTIGYEHEGYVNDASWYTVAMYTSSADLSKDVVNSGYGINPLRTGFWPWMAATYYNQSGIPGSCIKIKGHMHYPNQTHSDPGPNWNWDYYFKLINDNPTVIPLTSATGNFYDSGGTAGNYSNDERNVWVINPVGANSVSLTFSSFNLENTWDYLYIYDGNDVWSPLIGYYTGTVSPGTVTSTGGVLTIEFRSDCATTSSGWEAGWTSTAGAVAPVNLLATLSSCPDNIITFNWTNTGAGWYVDVSTDSTFTVFYNKSVDSLTSTSCPTGFCDYPNCLQSLALENNTTYYWRIWNGSSHTIGPSFTTNNCDITPPTTVVNAPNLWITTDFTATFSDTDNVGVEKSYYQVLDYIGKEWRANNGNGFFSDNFDTIIHPDWTISTGTWGISNSFLMQSDEALTNTNIYASLTQNLSDSYLYHWQGKIDGSGTNRRAGFHFFCSDGNLPNRGNSYFVWFRLDSQKLQFYKVTNDTFDLVKESVYAFQVSQWYDFKVIYDRITGKTDVYIDNFFIDSWTDMLPYSSGNYISFRSGNAAYTVNDLKIYRSRSSSVTVTVGAGSTNDIRYQNPNPSFPSGRISSIVNDAAGNFSTIGSKDVNIDWSPPLDIFVNDGVTIDIDTTSLISELSANWASSADTHSAVATYWYAIDTVQGGSNIVNWTSNGQSKSVTHTGLSLSFGKMYFVSVKVENGAGLFSNVISSDGQYMKQPIPPPAAKFTVSDTTICSGETVSFLNTSTDATNFGWIFQGGNPATGTSSNPMVNYDSSGIYTVTLIAYSTGNTSDTLIQNISVTVSPFPNASFIANATTIYMPGATAIFTNNSTNSSNYFWYFGDDSTSTLSNPTHSYPDTGYYSVTLVAANGLCSNDTLSMINYVYVAPDPTLTPPVASFFISGFGYVCQGDSVLFVNLSTNASSYQWSFAGGSPSLSTDMNPAVKFDSSGSYTVNLIATGSGGYDTLMQNISVNMIAPPLADFSVSDTMVYIPNTTVSFTNLSTGATSYKWYFGDTATSFDTHAVHTFIDTGYYSVTLVASNDYCPDDTLIFANYIHVVDTTPVVKSPVAGFTTSSTDICLGDKILFTNNSSNAASYSWTFSGGVPTTSSDTSPSVTFNVSGTYIISLVASGPGGIDTVFQTINVNVTLPPSAAFSSNDTVLLAGEIVTFINASVNATTYLWNFGDGTTSSDQNPWHQYSDTGYYTVILITMNNICTNDTLVKTNYIYVVQGTGTEKLSGNMMRFTVYPNPGNNNFTVEYTLPKIQHVTIKLVDVLGKEILLYQNNKQNAGDHRLTMNSKELMIDCGVYILQFNAGDSTRFVKLIVK